MHYGMNHHVMIMICFSHFLYFSLYNQEKNITLKESRSAHFRLRVEIIPTKDDNYTLLLSYRIDFPNRSYLKGHGHMI